MKETSQLRTRQQCLAVNISPLHKRRTLFQQYINRQQSLQFGYLFNSSLFEYVLKQFHGISEIFLKLTRSIVGISFVSRGFVYYGTFERFPFRSLNSNFVLINEILTGHIFTESDAVSVHWVFVSHQGVNLTRFESIS